MNPSWPPPTRLLSLLAILFVLLSFPVHGVADVIWLNSDNQPIYGIVDDAQSSDEQVAFAKTSNGSAFEAVRIDRSNIKAIVINVDKPKLASLAPDKPESWFDHAEWLATQKQDPVARKLAIRLLLITAKHSPEQSIRDSAVRNLIPLARTPEETRKFKRLSWLETGTPDPVRIALADTAPIQLDPQQTQLALEIIQAIRRKSPVDASRWSAISDTISIPGTESIEAMANAKELSSQQLSQLVALEFRLRNPGLPITRSNPTWLELQSETKTVDLEFPTIDNVTEIDPSKTLFRDGSWFRR